MIFNGIEKDYIKVNMALFRPPTPPIEFKVKEKVQGGSRKIGKRFTDMILPVPITIKSDRPIEFLKEEISNWLYSEEAQKLVFRQIPNRYYLAEYESMQLDEKGRYAKGVINFYLAEAYRYGYDVPIKLPSTFTSYAIKGQTKTPWTSKTIFTSAQSSFVLETDQGGKISLQYNFVVGDTLEIDYDKRKVSLNGNNLAVSILFETVWFLLNPGNVQIRASHPTTLIYTPRFY